jgi:branched-chain amino acid transport system permease protein
MTVSSEPVVEEGRGGALLARLDILPLLLVPVLALLALPLVADLPAWITLTVAGLAMGMMIFIMASGLTLVFGLMGVINFGHGAFISVGAFVAASAMAPFIGWMSADNIWLNLAALVPGILGAMAATALLGYVFERFVIMPVYGQHLKQILVTIGGLIVVEQLIQVVWGPEQLQLFRPVGLRGAIIIGQVAIERYRLVAVAVGLVLFLVLHLLLNRTKIGLLIRAGVENGEMVEALGYRIRRLFVGVFIAGSALAGLGGMMWGLYQETATAGMGMQVMVLIFIVVIIGGLGSLGGCFIGALLVGLVANYTGFMIPKLALGSNILLMVLILLWRPRGLYVVGRK